VSVFSSVANELSRFGIAAFRCKRF